MSLFFLAFFLIYGGTHLYLFQKMRQALSPRTLSSILPAFFLFLMVIMPVQVRVLENLGMETSARFAAFIGFLWMGFIFLYFSASIAIDIYGWLLRGAGFIFHGNFSSLLPAKRTALLLSLIWAAAAGLYGYYEAGNIKTERVVIKTAKIPLETGKLTIVQISDVHLGLIVRGERLRNIVDAINEASPDILVSTGDLVDGQINSMTGLAELLQDIRPRFGKFAVTGNHEIYAGLGQAIDFTERAGFRMLHDEAATAGSLINIVGVQDPAIERVTHSRPAPEKNILRKVPLDKFTLLLKHRPYVDPESLGLFDLQLSGHVHKGQIFPFNLITYLFFPVRTGFTPYPQNSAFYVSRGTGTWGPPIRFLAPPEITVIELIHAG